MIRPVEMRKIMVAAAKTAESRLISALHKTGMVEIRSLELPGMEKGRPLRVHDDLSRELVRVRGLINAFNAVPGAKREAEAKEGDIEYSTTLEGAASLKIDDELRRLVDVRASLLSEGSEIARKREEVAKTAHFSGMDFSQLRTARFTYVFGKIKDSSFPQFTKDMEEYLNREVEILSAPEGRDETVALIFYQKSENIEFLLSRYNFQKIGLPEDFSTFETGMRELEEAAAQNRKAAAEVDGQLAAMAANYLPQLLRLEDELSVLSARAAIATKFSGSRKIFAVEGWIRRKDMAALHKMLASQFAGEAELMDLGDEENAPIVLDNPKSVKQFEWLVEFYSLPSYKEIDPTFLLLFTVPIIYGMIVGDVGYGVISAILSWAITRKFKSGMLGNVAKIWLFSSVAAIVFGVVFDEWFGFTHMELLEWLGQWGVSTGVEHPLYSGISRIHELGLVIGLTLIVGLLHLTMGFVLGIINAWEHDKKHAAAKIMWLLLLYSGTAAVCAMMFGLIPAEYGTYSLAAFAIAGIAIVYLEGLAGLFEIPGLLTNVLSYARIAAAGVVGVILAEIINESLLPTPENLVLFPVFILLHLMNAGLAMFESIVQGGRLNLVEFYSKFFHGGGKAFEPFSVPESPGAAGKEGQQREK